jgi:hypothetical protein
MRGHAPKQKAMIVLRSPEDFVPQDHPIRAVKQLADAALKEMSATFDGIPPATSGGPDSKGDAGRSWRRTSWLPPTTSYEWLG